MNIIFPMMKPTKYFSVTSQNSWPPKSEVYEIKQMQKDIRICTLLISIPISSVTISILWQMLVISLLSPVMWFISEILLWWIWTLLLIHTWKQAFDFGRMEWGNSQLDSNLASTYQSLEIRLRELAHCKNSIISSMTRKNVITDD